MHVEVLLKTTDGEDEEYIPKFTIEVKVRDWLLQYLSCSEVGTYLDIPTDSRLQHAQLLQSVRIADFTGPTGPDDFHTLEGVNLIIHVYELCAPPEIVPTHKQGVQGRMLDLPSRSLAGIWDSLMFETIDPKQILRSIARISAALTYCQSALC